MLTREAAEMLYQSNEIFDDALGYEGWERWQRWQRRGLVRRMLDWVKHTPAPRHPIERALAFRVRV